MCADSVKNETEKNAEKSTQVFPDNQENAAKPPTEPSEPRDNSGQVTDEVVSQAVEEKKWYILRVQSGKEEKVKENLKKRIRSTTLQEHFGQVLVPSELVSEIKRGRKRVVERKLYPGYVVIEMHLTDETHYLVKGTPGVGDFVGTPSLPIPMSDEEVERMLMTCGTSRDKPKPKVQFSKGQNVKIKEGPFENFDGIVDEVNEQKGIVKVIVGIFGRYTQVELEYWQVESL